MDTEIEAKFLDIDKGALRAKLKELGAKLVHEERLMRRYVLDFPGLRLEQKRGWVRVRDEADKVTVSYKQLDSRDLDGTKEITFTVDDFESAHEFLEAIGLQTKAYQETKRESWQLGEVEIELDTWPWLPSFAEIEGPTESVVKQVAQELGFDWAKALHGSVEIVYQHYFEVTEEEVYRWEKIVFSDIPDWLEAKRKRP